MKRFFSLTVLVITIVALAAGCTKDDDNPVGNGNNNNNTAAMTGKIDGTTWKSVVAEVAIENEELDILGVQGDSSASLSLQFTIGNFHGTGTYQLDGFDNTAYIIDLAKGGNMTIYGVDDDPESQTGGELVVTEITTTSIKGTFHFTAVNKLGNETKSVTNGVFTIKL